MWEFEMNYRFHLFIELYIKINELKVCLWSNKVLQLVDLIDHHKRVYAINFMSVWDCLIVEINNFVYNNDNYIIWKYIFINLHNNYSRQWWRFFFLFSSFFFRRIYKWKKKMLEIGSLTSRFYKSVNDLVSFCSTFSAIIPRL